MCGILGAAARRNVVPQLIESLKRLEYRGYDSAGIALINHQATLERQRAVGKVSCLTEVLSTHPIEGHTGIAHTRWATHGVPHTDNAHPHMSHDALALVHNGIIENYEALRDQLLAQGYQFHSETDSEVVAHLLHHHLSQNHAGQTITFLDALRQTIDQLHGAYALAILDKNQNSTVWAVRKGSPLVIGLGEQENYIASDQLALLPFTQRFIFLEENDIACITPDSHHIYDEHGHAKSLPIQASIANYELAERGAYRHFMLKEIYEQPAVLQNSMASIIDQQHFKAQAFGPVVEAMLQKAKRFTIVACGTSYNAGLVAKYWLEALTHRTCQVEIASEYRYRNLVVEDDTLFITLSQSGETADTLACLRLAKTLPYIGTLTICNVAQSSLVRESSAAILTYAGPEIGVASTKAFITQLSMLLALALYTAQQAQLSPIDLQDYLRLPAVIERLLTQLDPIIQKLAKKFQYKSHALFLGRNTEYPIAIEGALKLKELSYIHAEAYPAGELKHGPLALVDEEMPVIVLAVDNAVFDKVKSNIQEVKARGGDVLIFTNHASAWPADTVVQLPATSALLAPFVFTVPLQLLAYHVAVLKGTDVDQPRNLAKSVTVE